MADDVVLGVVGRWDSLVIFGTLRSVKITKVCGRSSAIRYCWGNACIRMIYD